MQDLDENLEGNTNYSQATKLKDNSDPNYCLRTPAGETRLL